MSDTFSFDADIIDVNDGLSRMLNNKALFVRLLGKFSGRKLAEQISEAVNTNDFKLLSEGAHALKGVAANLSMPQLTRIAAKMENQAKTNELPSNEQLDELMTALAAVEKAIEILNAG